MGRKNEHIPSIKVDNRESRVSLRAGARKEILAGPSVIRWKVNSEFATRVRVVVVVVVLGSRY